MNEVFGVDAYAPKEVAERIENVGVVKARLPLLTTFALGVLAGGFIALGANFFTLVISDSSLSFGVSRVLGGLVFSTGLILVLIAGAELFTGNNLLVMALVAGRIRPSEIVRNWALVFLANFVGAAGIAVLVAWSGQATMNGGAVGVQMLKIAAAKTSLSWETAFFRGILCNLLVCLAVWCASAGRTVIDKVAAVIFPISAFVAAGFEHSVANIYFILLGWLVQNQPSNGVDLSTVNFAGLLNNLLPVTLGNIVGGSGMVALVYTVIYRRGQRT